jgi:hypothetical protein
MPVFCINMLLLTISYLYPDRYILVGSSGVKWFIMEFFMPFTCPTRKCSPQINLRQNKNYKKL